MLTTIAKRVQSRLSRLGVKATLGEIKEQCDRMICDINNTTETDILNVTEYFMNNATKLTIVNDDVPDVHTASIQDISNDGAIAVSNPNETITNEPAPLATTNKSELVATTANNLGIVLNQSEIELIAENVNYSSDDLQETLQEVKTAIIAFINHRVAQNNQKINETVQEIVQVATDGLNQNSAALTDGLRTINHQLQEQSKDFKSKVKASLKCFQLPAAS